MSIANCTHTHTHARTHTHAPTLCASQGNTVEEVLNVINRKELYGPMTMPEELCTTECPRSVFEWMEAPVALPTSLDRVSKKS